MENIESILKSAGARVCIVGTPRSGTNLLEYIITQKLVSDGLSPVSLGEYLHWWSARYSISAISEDNAISVSYYKRLCDPFREMEKRIEFLKKATTSQSMVAKSYFVNSTDKISFIDVLDIYKNAEFEFIYIKRDYKDQLISMQLSSQSGIWNSQVNSSEITIDIDKMKLMMITQTLSKIIAEEKLSTIPHSEIMYEDLVEYVTVNEIDTGNNIKMTPDDPYSIISNADEVKSLLETQPILEATLRDCV